MVPTRCVTCNCYIPLERLLYLREKDKPITCILHSKEEPTIGFMVYGHKTAGAVVIVPKDANGQNDPNTVEIAKRAYRRAR